MKNLRFLLKLTCFIGVLTFIGSPQLKAQIIYQTNDAKEADFKVFISQTPNGIDLYVYRSKLEEVKPGNIGYWHFGDKKNAQKTIFIVNKIEEADLTIFIGRDTKLTGWKNETKKYLLDK
jgi:hypothetical protein